MLNLLLSLVVGTALIFLGRWKYKNPRKFDLNWLYTNPQHAFLVGYGRFFATFLIFAGFFAIIAAIVSHHATGSFAFFVSIAGGFAGALFLRPSVEQSVPARSAETSAATSAVRHGFLTKRGKWAVGVLLGVALLLATGAIGFLFHAVDNSEVCRLAVQQAQSSSVVAERLGQPIERGLVGGSIEMSGSSGNANIGIPLVGPRGAGVLHAVAVRKVGVWKFETLELDVRGDSSPVDLLNGPFSPR